MRGYVGWGRSRSGWVSEKVRGEGCASLAGSRANPLRVGGRRRHGAAGEEVVPGQVAPQRAGLPRRQASCHSQESAIVPCCESDSMLRCARRPQRAQRSPSLKSGQAPRSWVASCGSRLVGQMAYALPLSAERGAKGGARGRVWGGEKSQQRLSHSQPSAARQGLCVRCRASQFHRQQLGRRRRGGLPRVPRRHRALPHIRPLALRRRHPPATRCSVVSVKTRPPLSRMRASARASSSVPRTAARVK
jgi:hypothetical protein